ncbi:RNA-binding S4 domain-containing protein [Halocynthiibacter sp. C4]|uniref:RNA-binding S4 domain-containing protein n=1 Tax=Halocynthiibacter sp. C4 TaxID=2992758 RepID=UPI00237B04DF|nr:RNA-binding S4 domain-containing protein [Halocynthiibacter sp. C4]MDE0589057.1 RNA-binding S4 domain-containing protein [Halocynthiibacter sp. C4]
MNDAPPKLRIDKWLWHARFFKTRSLATKVVTGGHLRVDGQKISKASHAVSVGDTLTFPQAKRIRVVRIAALSERRGPAPEAQALYEDLTPVQEKSPAHSEKTVPAAPKFEGKGRPTKKERRKSILSRRQMLERSRALE